MIRSWGAVVLIAACGLVLPAHAASCLHYAPAHVALHGTLVRLTFPGAPNFESVAQGDAPETGFYLRLTSPVCTKAQDDVDDAKTGVTQVQLLLDAAGYARLRPSLGRQLTLSGTLSGAITGHHHAPLLFAPDPPGPGHR